MQNSIFTISPVEKFSFDPTTYRTSSIAFNFSFYQIFTHKKYKDCQMFIIENWIFVIARETPTYMFIRIQS